MAKSTEIEKAIWLEAMKEVYYRKNCWILTLKPLKQDYNY